MLTILNYAYSHSTTTLSHSSQHCSKSEHQGDFKPFIKEITLTYKLISLKQLDNLFCLKKVAYHNFAAVHFSVNPIARTSSTSCEDWNEQIFSKDQQMNNFFPLCLPSGRSSTIFLATFSAVKSCSFSWSFSSRHN